MKFGTNVWYDKLYSVIKFSHILLTSLIICVFFFLSNRNTVTDFSAPIGACLFFNSFFSVKDFLATTLLRILKFGTHHGYDKL